MADQYIGEIRIFAFGATPADWISCDGQFLSIAHYSALSAVIGTTYGGRGYEFALPNLNGRAVLGAGIGSGLTERKRGDTVGVEAYNLFVNNFPYHSHSFQCVQSDADGSMATDMMLAKATAGSATKPPAYNAYAAATAGQRLDMGNGSISEFQSNPREHNNMQPYLALRFCIAFMGIVPTPEG